MVVHSKEDIRVVYRDGIEKIQVFYPTILTYKKLRGIFIFGKNGNYLKANLLKSRDAKPEGAKVRKFDHVSRLLLFPYV